MVFLCLDGRRALRPWGRIPPVLCSDPHGIDDGRRHRRDGGTACAMCSHCLASMPQSPRGKAARPAGSFPPFASGRARRRGRGQWSSSPLPGQGRLRWVGPGRSSVALAASPMICADRRAMALLIMRAKPSGDRSAIGSVARYCFWKTTLEAAPGAP